MKLLVWVVTTQRAQYKLTSIVDIRDVKATVVNVCSKTSLDSYSNGEQETNYAVVLSNSELGRIFGDGAIRKPSRSSTLVYILRQAVWYKYSYGGTTDQYVQLSLIPDRNLLIYIVNFEFVPIESLVFFWGTRQCPMTHWQLRKQVCAYTISWRDWHKQFKTFTNMVLHTMTCVLMSSMNLF